VHQRWPCRIELAHRSQGFRHTNVNSTMGQQFRVLLWRQESPRS
jgi:hypothetical protein